MDPQLKFQQKATQKVASIETCYFFYHIRSHHKVLELSL